MQTTTVPHLHLLLPRLTQVVVEKPVISVRVNTWETSVAIAVTGSVQLITRCLTHHFLEETIINCCDVIRLYKSFLLVVISCPRGLD